MPNKLQQERILAGQCPNDGNEAAPYRLCHSCRQKTRFRHALKAAGKKGIFKAEKTAKGYVWSMPTGYKNDPSWAAAKDAWEGDKRSENMGLAVIEGDKRYDPKLRGIRVDVGRTLLQVINFIDRPATLEEIMAVWGKLRAERSEPLAHDLGRLIMAQEKRDRRNAKRVLQAST